MYRILQDALFSGPPRGPVQLLISLACSIYYVFFFTGRFGRLRPTLYEQFQAGNLDDVAVLFGLFLVTWIGYSIAVAIVDYRSTGRMW